MGTAIDYKRRLFIGLATTVALSSLLVANVWADDKIKLKVAWVVENNFFVPDTGKKYWNEIVDKFQKKHPNVEIEQILLTGGMQDVVQKLGLIYRSDDTRPDLGQLNAAYVAQFSASDYLFDMTEWANKADWFQGFPDGVKNEAALDGKIFGVSHGENNSGIIFRKDMFEKAGLDPNWQPKTWEDVLNAARAIKAKLPGVWPLFIQTGTAAGADGVKSGLGNLLLGSSDPTIYDAAAKKWVVDSKGIRESLQFLKTAAQEGLLPPSSQVLDPNAGGLITTNIPQGKVAISICGNYNPDAWTPAVAAPLWAEGATIAGAVGIPTIDGRAPGIASMMGGWDLAISKNSKHPELAWEIIEMLQEKENSIKFNFASGWIPPKADYAVSAEFNDLAPPFHKIFGEILKISQPVPTGPEFGPWTYAMAQAGEKLVIDPNTSIDQVVADFKAYVINQIGEENTIVHK
jgi:multiple sugar transport system substrate-binding protein